MYSSMKLIETNLVLPNSVLGHIQVYYINHIHIHNHDPKKGYHPAHIHDCE